MESENFSISFALAPVCAWKFAFASEDAVASSLNAPAAALIPSAIKPASAPFMTVKPSLAVSAESPTSSRLWSNLSAAPSASLSLDLFSARSLDRVVISFANVLASLEVSPCSNTTCAYSALSLESAASCPPITVFRLWRALSSSVALFAASRSASCISARRVE